MKRLFNLFLMCMALWVFQAQAESYTLKCSLTPAAGGALYCDWNNANGNSFTVEEGQQVYMYCSMASGFRFVHWTDGDSILGVRNWLYYTMPAHDVELTAELNYNPYSPSDPDTIAPKHIVTLKSEPEGVGGFNNDKLSCEEGSFQTVYAYNRNNFKMQGWKCEGNWVSKYNYLNFTMGTEDVTYIAVYEYAPAVPSNPSSNYWNPETGEVIMDDYDAGNLISAIYEKTGDAEAVRQITVAGQMFDWDFCLCDEYPNCTYIDLSRMYGCSFVISYAFDETGLETIILPSCINTIGKKAFYNCSRLMQLYCHAVTPPIVGAGAFEGVDSSMVVYVPAASVALYKASEYWSRFADIRPFTNEVWTLFVNLPEESADGRYRNMILSLLNTSSGQTTRYIVTADRIQYVFNSLLKADSYNVSLSTSNGDVLGTIEGISNETDSVFRSFEPETLKSVFNPSVEVLTPDLRDVTSAVTVTWYDKSGNYLSQGTSLNGIVENTEVSYGISLPDSLAIQYEIPSEQKLTVSSGEVQTCTLIALDKMQWGGTVVNADEQPLKDALVSVVQKVNNRCNITKVVRTDDQGIFSTEVYTNDSVSVSVSKADYVSTGLPNTMPSQSGLVIKLKSISGATISTHLLFRAAGSEQETVYNDSANVSFTLFNVTDGVEVDSFNVQLPKIVLLKAVDNGDSIRLTAHSRTNSFNDVSATVQISEIEGKQTADANLHIVGKGSIFAKYDLTDNASVVGTLYDGDGAFVKRYTYEDKSLTIADLSDGEYTLMSMAYSNLFNTVLNLSSLSETGLVKGTDYLLNQVTVRSGRISAIENQSIPFLKENKLYYTGSATSFAAAKASVVVGNYMTMKGQVDFKEAYRNSVDNVNLVVELPDACTFVDNSVLVNSQLSSYTLDANRIIIPLDNATDPVRFCIVPGKSGECCPNAFVRFTCDGNLITQPVGSAPFTVKDLTLTAPESVAKPKFTVTGTAVGKSTVSVYAGDVLLGETTSAASGNWSASIELPSPDSGSYHQIHAKVLTSAGAELLSETRTVLYDPSTVRVSYVKMYHNNPEMNRTYEVCFDYEHPEKSPGYYTYYIYNRQFSFIIKYTGNNKNMKGVALYVLTAKGNKSRIEATYNETKDYWFAVGNFGTMYDGNLPTNVIVTDSIYGDQESTTRDANFGIDPSGYVYEAVKTNRLQGVTATVYYKEPVCDEHGDVLSYKEVLWDAEDYEQENPLLTDENGMYRWDVPIGTWRVKFVKDGYQTTYSEWLPVPPPQLDINIPMSQTNPPSVSEIRAYEDGNEKQVEIIFDKYMKVSTLTTDNVYVTQNENVVGGTIEALNGDGTYATRFRFTSNGLQTNTEVKLFVSNVVESYAGVQMEKSYNQELNVIKEVKELKVDSLANILYGQEAFKVTVYVLPADASAGKTLTAVSTSEIISKVVKDSVVIDSDGKAELELTGEIPGMAMINLSVVGTDVEGSLTVNVTKDKKITQPPVSTKADGALYRNSNIVLTSATDDARIYYTLDGSEPTEESSVYSEPIVVEGDVTVKTFAVATGWEKSEVKTYSYTIKKSGIGLNLSQGWNWVSHNAEEAVAPQTLVNSSVNRFVGRRAELISDPVYGMVGNLSLALPQELYKVEMTEGRNISLSDYNELNAAETSIALKEGFNWIGYPVNFEQTVTDAMKYASPSDGDYIIGRGGHAEFNGTEWSGDLTKLVPGQGYIYYAKSALSFVYNTVNAGGPSLVAGVVKPQTAPWYVDKHKYASVMCIVADLSVNGVTVNSGSYDVGAFSGNECRGIAVWNNGKLMLTVYGNNGDDIQLRAFGRNSDEQLVVNDRFVFQEELKGSIEHPLQLKASMVDAIGSVQSEWGVYPSRFEDYLQIKGLGMLQCVIISDMTGKVIMQLNDVMDGEKLQVGSLAAGTYILTAVSEGQPYYMKITKN